MSESEKISEIDNMGREKFWQEPNTENNGLALKLFQQECCRGCICKTTTPEEHPF